LNSIGNISAKEKVNELGLEILDLEKKLRNFNRNTDMQGAQRSLGFDPDVVKAKVKELRAERENLVKELNKPALSVGGAPKGGKPPTGNKGSKQDPGKKVVDNLKRQIALYGETTEVARQRYEIEYGSLQSVSEAQKVVITNYAEQKDALDAAKQEQLEYDDIVAEGVELAKKQRQEMERERESQVEALNSVKEFLQESNRTELEELQAHYDERKRIILESTVGTETERLALLAELDEVALAQRQAFSDAQNMLLLSSASNSFNQLAALTEVFAGEQSAIYKGMFAAAKAFAIAEASVKMYQAVSDAYTAYAGIAYVGPALGAAAAANVLATGAGLIGAISSVDGIAHGGLDNVPSESTYLLDKGERVLSPKQNTDLTLFLKKNNDGKSASNSNVYNNYITVNVKSAPNDSAGVTGQKTAEAISRAIARQEIKTASRPNGLLNKTTKFV